jgi:hypothetical protein
METKKLLFRYFLFCSLFITNTLYSQELQTVSRIGLGINGLDLAVELPIAKKITIEPSIGLGPSYDFGEGEALTFRMDWHWTLLNPSVHLGVNGKFIYNHKSEPKLFNSGNFIGLKVKYVSKPLTDEIHYLTNTLLTNLNCINPDQLFFCEIEILQCIQIVFQLIHVSGSNNHRCNPWISQHPCNSHLCHCLTTF